ncbi:MAG TPA: molybdopterin molybdotransferase MoeA [Gammaproteobacteria bacterium]|nr:molybdopterin molybdotransferase MoeA [Gammaproteobacteria bacterium]HIL94654.1 molybdopterin molybdenumtransferase MoeA [Pseudomonadales bacterium]
MAANLTPVDEVIEYLTANARCLAAIESTPLRSALGRVLAVDVVSAMDVPMLDNSAMDGYAINTSGLSDGAVVAISDRIPAGTTGQTLVAGTAARIFTGAPIPTGANAVIIQENTQLIDDSVRLQEVRLKEARPNEVRLNEIPKVAQNIRKAGQDIKAGTVVLSRGRKLRAQDLGLIASVGFAEIEVFRKLKIAVMSTGDELVDPPAALLPGQIYNSNHYTLQALIQQLDMEAIDLGMIADTAEATEAALLRGAELADCILSTGGVSVGEEDYVKGAVEKLGQLDLWRLAIKPGKPLAFGRIGQTPFFGLPGNPVSSFVTFTIVARPYLLKSQGATELELSNMYAQVDFDRPAGARREYCRVRVAYDATGQGTITNFTNQGSGVMSSVSWANGLAEIEIDHEVRKGDFVKVYLLP